MVLRIYSFLRKLIPFAAPAMTASVILGKHVLSKKRIKSIIRERDQLFLEVGAGEKMGRGNWLTIDITGKCDIFWDLRKGIPFPTERITKIYSCHFLEHLPFKEIRLFLDECKRVLIPGGTFSICVPNARLYIEAYMKPEVAFDKRLFEYEPGFDNTTKMDYMNYIAYLDGLHKYMFDEDNLLHILRAQGFKNVRLRPFDPSLDLKERQFGSIYAEAEK